MQLKQGVLVCWMLLAFGCGGRTVPSEQELIGEYRLYFAPEYAHQIGVDRLVLQSGGRYTHEFRAPNGSVRASTGRWAIIRDKVMLRDWADYAGITSLQPRGERVLDWSAFVEGTPPTIVLEGDRNIFYAPLNNVRND
jgi:hypothetical protein